MVAGGRGQQHKDHACGVLAQGGSEDATGTTARAGRASSGGDRGQRGLCSKYGTCTLFKAVEKLYPMIL